MIKTRQTTISYSYLLNEQEGELFKNCLQYVKHRQEKHPTCGARVIPSEEVNKMLEDLNYEDVKLI